MVRTAPSFVLAVVLSAIVLICLYKKVVSYLKVEKIVPVVDGAVKSAVFSVFNRILFMNGPASK